MKLEFVWAEKPRLPGETEAQAYYRRKRESEAKSDRDRKRRQAAATARGTHCRAEWVLLLELCGLKCVRCGVSLHEKTITQDHVIPFVFEGFCSDAIWNVQPLCLSCNCWKADYIDRIIDFVPPEVRRAMLSEESQKWINERREWNFFGSDKAYGQYRWLQEHKMYKERMPERYLSRRSY